MGNSDKTIVDKKCFSISAAFDIIVYFITVRINSENNKLNTVLILLAHDLLTHVEAVYDLFQFHF